MPHRAASVIGETPRQQLKLLLWPLLIALLVGLGAIGEPLEDGLRILRNRLHVHQASGDIVIVQVDDKSRRAMGEWPWKRSAQARVYDALNKAGAKKIVADINYSGPSTTSEDKLLEAAIANARDVTLAVVTVVGAEARSTGDTVFAPFAKHSTIATSSTLYNWQGAVWEVPGAQLSHGKLVPSLAWVASERREPLSTKLYKIDYSIDPDSIPAFSAVDVAEGRVDPAKLRGKTVFFGTNSVVIGDQYMIPGNEKRGGIYHHALGAETLRVGLPVNVGWVPLLLVALFCAWLTVRRDQHRFVLAAIVPIALAPILFETRLVFIDVVPALILCGGVMARRVWGRLRSGGLVNGLTGLPNLAALRITKQGRDLPLVGVRIHNYAEIASTLNADGEKQLVEQIVQRFNLGSRDRTIYQGDEGIFAWFADRETPFATQLEALHALFRSPVRVDKRTYDVSLSFGVELGSSRSISSRLGSALVAAQEADAESLKWKLYDPSRLQEASWRLSLLSQLDQAIDNGEVWLAYQPKVDLATRRTVGAEALARWTHPEKGPISPTEFITAAEHSDRIERLTDFVLEEAIKTAAILARKGHDFGIAVNLSARMLTDRSLPERVAGFLGRHGLRADRLTLELTETAAVADSGYGLELLARLREIGVKIAIDDYGTGLSTLEYLKKVPASEIKIDQSFIRSMRDNRSDLIMVQSTITLAKSLGRIVVAEGVEDSLSLEQLSSMGCDQAQGFIIGRPMGHDEMIRRLDGEKRRSKAA